jgi:Predicted SAM-dependent RNA methyltransferase
MSSPFTSPPAAQLTPSDAARSYDRRSFTFIVEHLDPELGPWSTLEYQTIARECRESGNAFILSSVPDALMESGGLEGVVGEGMGVERKGVEELFPLKGRGVEGGGRWIGKGIDGGDGARMGKEGKICLLDPQAERELSPGDGEVFRGFLFGGILGMDFYFLVCLCDVKVGLLTDGS